LGFPTVIFFPSLSPSASSTGSTHKPSNHQKQSSPEQTQLSNHQTITKNHQKKLEQTIHPSIRFVTNHQTIKKKIIIGAHPTGANDPPTDQRH